MGQSPCVRICTLNDDKVCIGCGRNIDEIKNWSAFSDESKIVIQSQLKGRLDDILQKMRAKRMQKS
ncbi:MAG: DUF1289 domain-containing protein [Proteobacteria bacterium]|nr:DUF1289 domain-containing protein [Pseudomonadota bacterium]